MKIARVAVALLFIAFVAVPVFAAPTIEGGLPSWSILNVSQTGSTVNTSYYPRDTSLPITGQDIYRDVGNSNLNLYGGRITAGDGGIVSVQGATSGDSIVFYVPDMTLTANLIAGTWKGTVGQPYLDMNSHQIKTMADPTNNQDAVTLAYYNAHLPSVSGDGWNLSYYLLDTSRHLTGNHIGRDVENDFLAITGGTGGVPYSGQFQLYGGSNPSLNGGFSWSVGDAAGNALKVVVAALGRTDTPSLDLMTNRIINLQDPVNPQDAVTLNRLSTYVGNNTGTALNGTYYILLDSTSGYVGINNPNPVMALDVNGLINATNFITNSSAESVYIGVNAGKSFGTNHSTLVGEYAGYPVGMLDQIAVGNYAGYQNKGLQQVAMGSHAGYQCGGIQQVVIGDYTGYQTTALGGSYQTAIGSSAGYKNRGWYQTAIGSGAGYKNIGYYQTAIGNSAGYNNTGTQQLTMGFESGYQNAGTQQTAVGYQAGLQNTGSYQTAIGSSAGYQNTGNYVIAIGYEAGKSNIIPNKFFLKQNNVNTVSLIEGNFSSGLVSFPNYAAGTVMSDASGNLYISSDEKLKTDIKPFTSGIDKIKLVNPISYKFNTKSGLDTINTYFGFSADNLLNAIPEAVFSKPDVIYQTITQDRYDERTKETNVYESAISVPVLDKDGKQTVTLSVSDRAIIAVLVNAVKEQQATIEKQQAQINNLTARIEKLEAKVK